MSREIHVRFCEGLGVQFPWATRHLLLASSADAARQALEDGRAFLKQRLKLHLNVHPRPIGSLEAGFVFLGIYFRRKQRRIAKAKIGQMKAEVRSFWQRYGRARVSTVVQEVNESILGWQRYYGIVQPAEQFSQLDGFIAEGLARALSNRITDGELPRNADLYSMIRELEFFV